VNHLGWIKAFPRNKTAHLLGVDWQIHAKITAGFGLSAIFTGRQSSGSRWENYFLGKF
jgi:hypothetical protein